MSNHLPRKKPGSREKKLGTIRTKKSSDKEEMEGLDTLATQKSWVQGSLQKPFTSIVTLYMHEQLSLDEAVREITTVIKNVYYGDGDVAEYFLDLWLTTLHISKKLPRPTTASPDLPTPSQSRLLALLSTLRRQPNPIPRPQIDTQNPIPDAPIFASSSSSLPLPHPSAYYSAARRITWSQLPLFLDGVRMVLHDEPGRASGFSDLEARAWEDLVTFLALCARDQIVPDPGSDTEAMGTTRDGGGGVEEGEAAGGLDVVAVRMIKGALEVRHFPMAAVSGGKEEKHRWTLGKGRGRKEKEEEEEAAAAAAAAKDREKGQVAEAVKLNVYVAAAALWAVIMGEELWERQGQKVESPVGLSLEPVPEVPAGKISKSRWRMWIDRFQFMSLREDLRMSTRELAAEAAAVMLRVV